MSTASFEERLLAYVLEVALAPTDEELCGWYYQMVIERFDLIISLHRVTKFWPCKSLSATLAEHQSGNDKCDYCYTLSNQQTFRFAWEIKNLIELMDLGIFPERKDKP